MAGEGGGGEVSDAVLLNCTQLLVADVAQWQLNRSQLLQLLEAALGEVDAGRRDALVDCLFGPGAAAAAAAADAAAGHASASRPYALPWWQKLAWTLVFGAMLLVATGGNIIVMWIVLGHVPDDT
ncbi:Tachykinin-like peptides receptor 86C [Gryllus bimaculatus]|nr:Tachykinin-like peptides receptor 86C [Gryllus bimaculatus]